MDDDALVGWCVSVLVRGVGSRCAEKRQVHHDSRCGQILSAVMCEDTGGHTRSFHALVSRLGYARVWPSSRVEWIPFLWVSLVEAECLSDDVKEGVARET